MEGWRKSTRKALAGSLLIAICRMHNLIEMRIDFVGQLIEVTPLLAKFGRFMRQAQQVPILPLNVVDDSPPIQAAMQADGHEPGLPRHESGALGHQRQSLCLLLRLGLDNRDLCYGLFVSSNVRHGRPRLNWKRSGRYHKGATSRWHAVNLEPPVVASGPAGGRAAFEGRHGSI